MVGIQIVRGLSLVCGSHIHQLGAALFHDFRHPEGTADFHQLTSGDNDLLVLCKGRETEHGCRRVVVDHHGGFRPRNLGQDSLHMVMAGPSGAALHIIFQIGIVPGYVHDALACLVRQICPSQVRVKHHPCCIDDAPQALFLLACNAGHDFCHQCFLGPHLIPPAFQDVLPKLLGDFPDGVHNHCSGRTFRKKKETLILQHLVYFRNLSE